MNAQEETELQDKMQEFLLAGGSIHDLYGITEDQLEALYSKGFQEYTSRQYDKAIKTFTYLLYLKSDEKRYLFALAAVLQVTKEYKKALLYYSLAANQDIDDPTITLHIAECLVGLEMRGDALGMVDILVKETATEPQWSALHTKALAYQTLLTQKNTAK